ncbi:uncharacterized protein [Amphiura filiformis]|uniref:uncharacterized protein n=1 Tax=Amphiura filiformis TaxID=82378 RepID=UPI003B20CB8E
MAKITMASASAPQDSSNISTTAATEDTANNDVTDRPSTSANISGDQNTAVESPPDDAVQTNNVASRIRIPDRYSDEITKSQQGCDCLVNIRNTDDERIIYGYSIKDAKCEDIELDSKGTWIMITHKGMAVTVNHDGKECVLGKQTNSKEQRFLFDAGRLRWEKDPKKVLTFKKPEKGTKKNENLCMADEDAEDYGQKFIYNQETNKWMVNVTKKLHYLHCKELEEGSLVYMKDVARGEKQVFHMVSTALKQVKINIEYDLEAAKKKMEATNVFSYEGKNNALIKSTINIKQNQIKTTTDKKEFKWNNKLNINAEAKFEAGVPVFGKVNIKVGINNTFEIGQTKTISKTEEKQWEWHAPIEIPPYTELTFNLVVEEGIVEVPYTASITHGGYTCREKGIYIGVNGMDFKSELNTVEIPH